MPPTRPLLRIDLRSLLLWPLYASIGLAIGSAPPSKGDLALAAFGIEKLSLNLFNGLLASASAAVAVGLIQQARAILRQSADWPSEQPSLRTSARWEASLRVLLALVIVTVVAIQAMVTRGFIELPKGEFYFFEDVVTQYVWWLAILVALTDAFMRANPHAAQRRRKVVSGLLLLGLLFLLLHIVTDLSFITFLVHAACRGVDSTHSVENSRYPITSDADEWLLFGAGFAGIAAIVVAAATNFAALQTRGLSGVSRPAILVACGSLSAAAAGYCYWFFAIARPYYSADLVGVGFAASWWHQVGGIALAATWITYAVYHESRAAHTNSPSESSAPESVSLPVAADGLIVLALISLATTIYLAQLVWQNYDNVYTQSKWEGLGYMLFQPVTCFMTALLLRSLQLVRLRWSGKAPAPLTIIPVKSSELIVAWLLLAAIVAVAIPTFAAFSFSFWLGPWYR